MGTNLALKFEIISAVAMTFLMSQAPANASSSIDSDYETPIQFIINDRQKYQNYYQRQQQLERAAKPTVSKRATGSTLPSLEGDLGGDLEPAKSDSASSAKLPPLRAHGVKAGAPKGAATMATIQSGVDQKEETLALPSEAAKELAPSASTVKPSPADCKNSIVPPSSLQQSQALGQTFKEAVAKITPPTADEDAFKIEENDYDQYGQSIANAKKEKAIGKPKSEFVKKLLQYAEQEVRRPRKGIRNPRKPKGMCLQGVRMAFERAAGENMHGWTLSAKDAGPYVKHYGYHKVKISDLKQAPVGAVIIYNNVRGGHGHIEIKGTDGYYSDFYSPWPINDPRALGAKRQVKEVWVPN